MAEFKRPVVRVVRFTAGFFSSCDGCGWDIEAGEEAGYIGDNAGAASCGKCCDKAEGIA